MVMKFGSANDASVASKTARESVEATRRSKSAARAGKKVRRCDSSTRRVSIDFVRRESIACC